MDIDVCVCLLVVPIVMSQAYRPFLFAIVTKYRICIGMTVQAWFARLLIVSFVTEANELDTYGPSRGLGVDTLRSRLHHTTCLEEHRRREPFLSAIRGVDDPATLIIRDRGDIGSPG